MRTKSEIGTAQVSMANFSGATTRKPQPELPDFSRTMFRLLEEIGLRYCVLAKSHSDPYAPIVSLDTAVDSKDRGRLPLVLQKLREKGYLPLQSRPLAANDCRYDFAASADKGLSLFTVMFLEPFPKGRCFAIDDGIFARRQWRGDCWVASDEDEYRYLLWKVSDEGRITNSREARLKQLAESLGRTEAEAVAACLFRDGFHESVVAACISGEWPNILQGLRGQLKRPRVRGASLARFAYLYCHLSCVWRRWLQPSGVYIVILGPDGVGKSTLTNKILELLGPLFASSRIFQWRPQVIKPRAGYSPFFNPPHTKPPHGSLESILRIIAVVLDYWVGYLTVIRPLLSRAGLIIYDRDFHDLLVDRLRYRYGGPHWLPDVAAKLLPTPETVFLTLDADTNIILGRKQEVAPDELRRQRVAYADLAGMLPNSTVVRTDQEFEVSTSEAMAAILKHLAQRFEYRERKRLEHALSPTTPDRTKSEYVFLARRGGSGRSSPGKGLSVLWSKWRVWFVKGFMTVTDQGFISGSNFVLGIILARCLSASQYGAYAIAYSTFVLFSLIHQALVLEPMTVLGSSLYRNTLRPYLSRLTWMQFAFTAVVLVCLGLFGFAGSLRGEPNGLKLAFAGMCSASPFVLLFWYARRAYYIHLLPGSAVIGAILYSVLLGAGIGSLYFWQMLSPFSTFLVMGASAFLTSILLLFRLRSNTTSTADSMSPTPGQVVLQHWRYGGWALVGMVFFWVPWNIFYSVVTRFSGLEGAATLKAVLNLSLPMTATYGAFSMLFLPYTARLGAEGGWKAARLQAWKIASLFVLGSGAYWLVVCLFRTELIHFLYKGQYAEVARVVPVVAISSILSGAAMGPTITIKAMRSPATVSGVYFGSTLVSLLVGLPACWAWGYRGAILAILLSSITACVTGILKCSDPRAMKTTRVPFMDHEMPSLFSSAAESSGPQEMS